MSLMANGVEHLSMCLFAICISSLVKIKSAPPSNIMHRHQEPTQCQTRCLLWLHMFHGALIHRNSCGKWLIYSICQWILDVQQCHPIEKCSRASSSFSLSIKVVATWKNFSGYSCFCYICYISRFSGSCLCHSAVLGSSCLVTGLELHGNALGVVLKCTVSSFTIVNNNKFQS